MENNGSILAKISIGISVVLLILVIVLFFKIPGGNDSGEVDPADSLATEVAIPDDGVLRICYFQGDSVQSLDMMAQLEKEGTKAQKEFDLDMKSLQSEVDAFQRKWGDPAKLFEDELRKYQEAGVQMQQQMAQKEQQAQMKLARKQEEITFKLISRVSEVSKKFARENGFDFIFSYQLGQNIYYGAPQFDVTKELMEMINEDYRSKLAPIADETVEAE